MLLQEKKEYDDSLKGQKLIEYEKYALEEEGVKTQAVNKKRKRKATASGNFFVAWLFTWFYICSLDVDIGICLNEE